MLVVLTFTLIGAFRQRMSGGGGGVSISISFVFAVNSLFKRGPLHYNFTGKCTSTSTIHAVYY
jgi:hypothetical protein